MKKNISIIWLLMVMSIGNAQNFSSKTNDIVLNNRNQTNALTAVSLPVITWKTPQMEYTNTQIYSVEIEALVSSDIDIKSIRIIIGDGKASWGEKPLDVAQVKEYSIKQRLWLMDGHNVIEILAENIQGGIVSSARGILVGKDAIADAIAIDRKDYALLFATDQYDNWTDLVNPIEDAQGIAKILKEKYGFQTEVVENPNMDDVFIKLADYGQRNYKPQDQLLIFFAGHGYFDDSFGEGFVVAKNSLMNDKAKTTYISHNRLRGVIDNIKSEHIFLAMDVCFGGTFDPVIAGARGMETGGANDLEFLVRKLSQHTRKYLTSGGKEYVSDGIRGQHSPFTLKLLEALSEGEGSDKILTISELKTYVEKLKPEPRLGSFGKDKPESDFVFVVKN